MIINFKEGIEDYIPVCPIIQDVIEYKKNPDKLGHFKNYFKYHIENCKFCSDKFARLNENGECDDSLQKEIDESADFNNIMAGKTYSIDKKDNIDIKDIQAGEIWNLSPINNDKLYENETAVIILKKIDNTGVFEVVPISFDLFFACEKDLIIPKTASISSNPFRKNYMIMLCSPFKTHYLRLFKKAGKLSKSELDSIMSYYKNNGAAEINKISVNFSEMSFLNGLLISNDLADEMIKNYNLDKMVIVPELTEEENNSEELLHYNEARKYLNYRYEIEADEKIETAKILAEEPSFCNWIGQYFSKILETVDIRNYTPVDFLAPALNFSSKPDHTEVIDKIMAVYEHLSGNIICELSSSENLITLSRGFFGDDIFYIVKSMTKEINDKLIIKYYDYNENSISERNINISKCFVNPYIAVIGLKNDIIAGDEKLMNNFGNNILKILFLIKEDGIAWGCKEII